MQHTEAKRRSQQTIGASQSYEVSQDCGPERPKRPTPLFGSSLGVRRSRSRCCLAASSARSRAARSRGVSLSDAEACGGVACLIARLYGKDI